MGFSPRTELTGARLPDFQAEASSTGLPEPAPRFANLVSSDLDADRIDYLMRTAHYTGLPYGSVDLAYLLSQLRFR